MISVFRIVHTAFTTAVQAMHMIMMVRINGNGFGFIAEQRQIFGMLTH